MVKNFFQSILYFFFLLCIFFIPVRFQLLSFNEKITDFIFRASIEWVTTNIFNWRLKNSALSSDALSLYVLVLLVCVLAIVISGLLLLSNKWAEKKHKIFTIMQKTFCYYLSLQMLLYGFDKIFKGQFYLPEPNTLYTPLGEVSRDLLYWSTMGTSYSYNIFLGTIEVLAAILLLCKRTRVLAILITTGIMLNVVAVNFSFDISVKVYSMFLLMLSLFLLSPQIGRLYNFLILQKAIQLRNEPQLPVILQKPFLQTAVKTFIVSLFFFEAFYQRLALENFNDDSAKRPYLHGVYEVHEVLSERNSIALQSIPLKGIFIHRQGYIIFQNSEGRMQDFKLITDSINHQLIYINTDNSLVRIQYNYNERDKVLQLNYPVMGKTCLIKAKALNWKNLPALQNNFHWTVDEL